MAVIDLNNIVKPKQANKNSTLLNTVVLDTSTVYTDLHLDIVLSKSIGSGLDPVETNDILVDHDYEAIKNSLRNIFTTKRGQKILNPNFGFSLEQYLFSPITDVNARAIGSAILDGITKYENRISVSNINITANPDENLYYIAIYYTLLNLNRQYIINMIAQMGGQLSI